jgi:hypothetical protein
MVMPSDPPKVRGGGRERERETEKERQTDGQRKNDRPTDRESEGQQVRTKRETANKNVFTMRKV